MWLEGKREGRGGERRRREEGEGRAKSVKWIQEIINSIQKALGESSQLADIQLSQARYRDVCGSLGGRRRKVAG